MGIRKDLKSKVIRKRVIDPLGRYIYDYELERIIEYFRDPYDPRLLAICLMYCCGLRKEKTVKLLLSDFTPDMKEIKTDQCKAHQSVRDGVVRYETSPLWAYLPPWLSKRLLEYIRYRLMVGLYVGIDLKNIRIFPSLRKCHIDLWFSRMRSRHGHEEKWRFMREIWQVVDGYDAEGNNVYHAEYHRVSPHACKAMYCTAAIEVSNGDLSMAMTLTGHKEVRNLVKYARRFHFLEKKEEIRDRFALITGMQKTPILKGQKKLSEFP